MRTFATITGALMILATVVLTLVFHFRSPDMTSTSLFLELWPLGLVDLGGAALLIAGLE